MHERAKEGLGRIDNGFVPSVVVEELVHVMERLKLDEKAIYEKL
jgi:predicted nucleic acid-binding protein